MKTQFDRPPWLSPLPRPKKLKAGMYINSEKRLENITLHFMFNCLLVQNFNVTTIELKYNYAALVYLPFFYEYIKFLKR